MIEDPSLFNDIAEALNTEKGYSIQPAFVEKDYYAVQLLNLINNLTLSCCSLVFAGGTCLAKAYQNTHRISEDLDIKFTASSGNLHYKNRKHLSALFLDALQESDCFELIDEPKYFNQRRTQIFEIQYPKDFSHESLRDYLRVELVESKLYGATKTFPIGSIYSEIIDLSPEISSVPCVNMESIIIEKMIALLWRTSAISHGKRVEDDEALVRHMYDIHLLVSKKQSVIDLDALKDISIKSLEYQANQYRSKYLEFHTNPKEVLSHGFDEIHNNPIHKQRYNDMLLPLIYSGGSPDWDEVLGTFKRLYQRLYIGSA